MILHDVMIFVLCEIIFRETQLLGDHEHLLCDLKSGRRLSSVEFFQHFKELPEFYTCEHPFQVGKEGEWVGGGGGGGGVALRLQLDRVSPHNSRNIVVHFAFAGNAFFQQSLLG
jgi:hypothetical protein